MIRVLWADDEIDLLRPHILFLEGKGYDVTSVTNGTDAVEQVRGNRFDVVFLDEQMPGIGGLDALSEIKALSPETPVVMITKSEEEHLMEDAIGGQIADYLIKPVNPKQILLTCKRLLEGERLREERASQDYLRRFGELTMRISGGLDHEEWPEVYQQLVRFGLELDADAGARQILEDQYREANREFGRYVEEVYPEWIAAARAGEKNGRPRLSQDVLPTWVLPELDKQRPVVFLLIDCMRYDQWLEFVDAWVERREPNITRMGFGYMLVGDAPASNIDPFAEGPTADNEWMEHGVPHVMIVVPNLEQLRGLPTDFNDGGPWVMYRDTPYAHIMVPLPGGEGHR
jgi:CheY-like chemotaxis protein